MLFTGFYAYVQYEKAVLKHPKPPPDAAPDIPEYTSGEDDDIPEYTSDPDNRDRDVSYEEECINLKLGLSF